VKNEDLWRRLAELAEAHDVDWIWVRGHSGHDGNEAADRLANLGVEQARRHTRP
jgi:ribonuclease HI